MMNLNRLKIEHSNAITADLASRLKLENSMMRDAAVNYMNSNDEADKSEYLKYKSKSEAFRMAIEITKNVSRDFEFKDDATST